MLKMSEIKTWEEKTITAKINVIRAELFSLRMQKVSSGLEKPHKIKDCKKDVARLLTVQNVRGRNK